MRVMGGMQLANEMIQVVDGFMQESEVADFIVSLGENVFDMNLESTDIRWYAMAPDEELVKHVIVGYAVLKRTENDEADFRWAIAPKYRGVGLGLLMARMATDQAIRYRLRAINASIESGRDRAIELLESEEFEFVPPKEAGTVIMRKELKWR